MGNVSLPARLANLSDQKREQAIGVSYRRLVTSNDLPTKAAAWKVLSRLVKGRSLGAIARLERERGLVKPS